MALYDELREGVNKLPVSEIMAAPAVTMDGEQLDGVAKALIWAMAVDEGFTDPQKVISEWNLTGDSNLSTCVHTTMDKLQSDFAEMQKQDPNMYPGGFEQYWSNFPITLQLLDGSWLVWCE